ncbi:MAG TPA: hypothetical protein VFC09_09700 [Candidatus Dormibacteraeota bacterium]|nr:hypothetical protein [Candidatus Dormibacteraeota bacterium]
MATTIVPSAIPLLCEGCRGPLTGRQRQWCREACRSRARRMAQAEAVAETRSRNRPGSSPDLRPARAVGSGRRARLASGFDDEPEVCLPGMIAGYTNTTRDGFVVERAHHSRWGTRVTLFRAACTRCQRHGLWHQTPGRAHQRFSDQHRCAP